MNPADPRRQPDVTPRNRTVLESVEDIRAQIRGAAAAREPTASPARPAEPDQDATPFRPALRPSMGLLYVMDDGEDASEILRIRTSSFTIGRVEGNLTIPHDSGISGRHAEISRRYENAEHVWYLTDLRSTNGTFVRAASITLAHEQEFLIGTHRYRFEAPAPSLPPEPAGADAGGTRKWEAIPGAQAIAAWKPVLLDVSPGRAGPPFPLAEQEYWLGRDPRVSSIVIDDPLADRRHARLFRDEKNRWMIANNRSRNGLWARIDEVKLGRGGLFQCGEQRFFFKVL
jgi:pSer/pThr/pTyr-binding forkhead associated (FHA) protein